MGDPSLGDVLRRVREQPPSEASVTTFAAGRGSVLRRLGRKRRSMRIQSVSFVLLLTVACGGTDEASRSESLGAQKSAIQGGQLDTNAKHGFAVGVANKLGGLCSGTLIAPNLVLTARHCVVPPSA